MSRDHPGVLSSTSSGTLVSDPQQSYRDLSRTFNNSKVEVVEDVREGEKTRLLQFTHNLHRSSMSRTSVCSEEGRIMNRHRVLIDVLIVMFGISAWIGVNGIYVQLPLLVAAAPEGWSLPAYIVVLVQIANVGPVLYALTRRFSPNLCCESVWISSLLVIGSVAMGVLGFLYDTSTTINGVEHSVALLFLVFATALVGCSSSILFVPYLRNFREVHLVSFFIGEGLSGLFPSAVALIQGVGGNPVCQGNTTNSTDSQLPLISQPNFSPKVYFLLLFAVLASSTCAFWVLEFLLAARNGRIAALSTAAQDSDCLYDHSILDKTTTFEATSVDLQSDTPDLYSGSTRGYLYVLMGLICFGGNGFLPGIQSYSCLPYGNVAYHLTVTLAHLSNPIACVVALWLPPPGPRGITIISTFAIVAASHVTWLAFLSPMPPWHDTTHGVILVVVAWVLLTGFVTYTKLSITAIFRREPGAKSLFYVGIVTQIGSAAGAICSFGITNFSNLLVPYTGCDAPA